MMTIAHGHPFQFSAAFAGGKTNAVVISEMNDFFPRFIEAMLKFFETRQSPVPREQTLEVAALIEAGDRAVAKPFEWVAVPTA